MYYVYFLESKKRQRFYIGVSSNVERRLIEHNQGATRSTKPYRPWCLIHFEEFETKPQAMKREWYLKHPSGYLEKKAIIEQYRSQGGFA